MQIVLKNIVDKFVFPSNPYLGVQIVGHNEEKNEEHFSLSLSLSLSTIPFFFGIFLIYLILILYGLQVIEIR